MQLIVEDVQRSIEYHYSQPGAQEVTQVFVSGRVLWSPVWTITWVRFSVSPHNLATRSGRWPPTRSNISDDQLRVMGPVLAVAVGLALEEA